MLGGVATFLTMSYIVFVNPAILSAAGMPLEAVAVATALAAAIATAAMALATNLPFALAPGLGINAVVAFEVIIGRGVPWPVGMAVIVIEGLLAVVLVVAGLREAIMRAVPLSLKLAIGVGIGLFITLVGLREGGIVVNSAATGIALGDLSTGPSLVALGGIAVAVVLAARRIPGAVVLGLLAAAVLGIASGVLAGPDGVADIPSASDFSTIGDALAPANLADALTFALIPVIFALFMTDFFDTIGTAVAVGRSGGLMSEQGELPETRRLLLVDSGAAALGGAMGTSSVTTYVESGAGVAEGARTGLASLVTAGCFALAIFFRADHRGRGPGRPGGRGHRRPPRRGAGARAGGLSADPDRGRHRLVAPGGCHPGLPRHRGRPLTFSIAAGIGLGVIGYVLVMAALSRARQVHPVMWLVAALFLLFFAADWLSANVF